MTVPAGEASSTSAGLGTHVWRDSSRRARGASCPRRRTEAAAPRHGVKRRRHDVVPTSSWRTWRLSSGGSANTVSGTSSNVAMRRGREGPWRSLNASRIESERCVAKRRWTGRTLAPRSVHGAADQRPPGNRMDRTPDPMGEAWRRRPPRPPGCDDRWVVPGRRAPAPAARPADESKPEGVHRHRRGRQISPGGTLADRLRPRLRPGRAPRSAGVPRAAPRRQRPVGRARSRPPGGGLRVHRPGRVREPPAAESRSGRTDATRGPWVAGRLPGHLPVEDQRGSDRERQGHLRRRRALRSAGDQSSDAKRPEHQERPVEGANVPLGRESRSGGLPERPHHA